MSRAAATVALVALAAAAGACGGESEGAGADRPAPTSATDEELDAAPVRGCRSRNEGPFPLGGPDADDVRLGPVYFESAVPLADESPSTFTPRAGRRHMSIKVLLAVPAGARVTLAVPPEARRTMLLDYAKGHGGRAAVELRACSADTPAFSYEGTVGPWTEFGGGFLLTGPGCHPVELHVAGRREPYRARLSFGAGAC